MKRYQKLIVLIILSLSVYLIYKVTNNNNIYYISLGDGLSKGQNSFGGTTYGYDNYLYDYLKTKNNVIYNNYFSRKDNNINILYNSILENKNIVIKNIDYNLKKSLLEADIITISIGLNDLIYESSIRNNLISSYEEDIIVNNVYNKFKQLMTEIRKYTKRKIYIIGYPEYSDKYNNLISKLNKKYKIYTKKYNIVYIDSNKVLEKTIDFDTKSTYPNTNGYKKIAEEIVKNLEK